MNEPRAPSFHGDQSSVRDQTRTATEDPEAAAAIREVERLLKEPHQPGAQMFRVGPNVLGRRPIRSR